jgi:hypothetical protein
VQRDVLETVLAVEGDAYSLSFQAASEVLGEDFVPALKKWASILREAPSADGAARGGGVLRRVVLVVDCSRINAASVETDVARVLGMATTKALRARNPDTAPCTLMDDSFADTFDDVVAKIKAQAHVADDVKVVVCFLGVDMAENRGVNLLEGVNNAVTSGTALHAVVAVYARLPKADCAEPFDKVLLPDGSWGEAAPGAAAASGAGGARAVSDLTGSSLALGRVHILGAEYVRSVTKLARLHKSCTNFLVLPPLVQD